MSEPLFRVEELRKRYGGNRAAEALRGVTLEIPNGACTAMAGRNGSGKTSLACCLAGVEEPSGGTIWRLGEQVWPGSWFLWPGVQMIRQDSPLAFNPRWRATEIIGEPLALQGKSPRVLPAEIASLAELVGLEQECLVRRPAELSGGQRQRIALARALAVDGLELLIADEPLRGLDDESAMSLLCRLRATQLTRRFAMLYLSHNFREIRLVADYVAVMADGRVVERSDCAGFFAHPSHSESQALLEAAL